MKIERIGIIGAGKMGRAIAITASVAGYKVLLKDRIPEILEDSMEAVKAQLERMKSKGKITDAKQTAAFGMIKSTSTYEDFKTVDFVIEAAAEDMEIKKEVFEKLDGICKDEAVLVSNTSTFSVTSIAQATNRPGRVAGMHFFLPPSRLVEITKGRSTDDSTIAVVRQVGEKLCKTCIEVKKDSPGFIANRIYTPLFVEAFRVYEEGLASIEEIDLAMKETYLPIGPFALADIIGLDVVLSGLEYYEKEMGPQWKAPQCLQNLVKEGKLGKKTGCGWYDY